VGPKLRFPLQKAKGADPNRARGGAAYPGEIIPEWRAKSSWNAERDQIGTGGDIIANSRATSPGIRTLGKQVAVGGKKQVYQPKIS
jgi:hypothetical protein